jgi:hypothetical protein
VEDGCVETTNFQCTRYDANLRKYAGLTSSTDAQGEAVIGYEDQRAKSVINVRVPVIVDSPDSGKSYNVALHFPPSVSVSTLSGQDLAGRTLFGFTPDLTPLGKPEVIRADILGMFDGLDSQVKSGQFQIQHSYTVDGEYKSEYSPDAIVGNFQRFSVKKIQNVFNVANTNLDRSWVGYELALGQSTSGTKSFPVFLRILPYRNGSAVDYKIPMMAILHADGTSVADPDADLRKSTVLKVLAD